MSLTLSVVAFSNIQTTIFSTANFKRLHGCVDWPLVSKEEQMSEPSSYFVLISNAAAGERQVRNESQCGLSSN